MSDELRRKVDLWTKIAELAAEEGCDAVFERACFVLEHLKNR